MLRILFGLFCCDKVNVPLLKVVKPVLMLCVGILIAILLSFSRVNVKTEAELILVFNETPDKNPSTLVPPPPASAQLKSVPSVVKNLPEFDV